MNAKSTNAEPTHNRRMIHSPFENRYEVIHLIPLLGSCLCLLFFPGFSVSQTPAVNSAAPVSNFGVSNQTALAPPEEKPPSEKKRPLTAKDFYEEGVAAFAGAEFALARRQFEKATELSPEYVDAHYKLGATYLRLRLFGQAWNEFRKANQLDPQHEKALSGFRHLWALYEKSTLLNVGHSPHRVTSALGQPDQEVAQGNRRRLTYNFMAVDFVDNRLYSILDTRDFSRPKAIALARLEFSYDAREWKPIFRKIDRRQAILESVPVEQSPRRKLEKIQFQRAIGVRHRGISAERFLANLRAVLQREDSKVVWNVIAPGKNDLFVEWRSSKTDARGNTVGYHTLARAIGGEKDVHFLTYTKTVPRLDETQRDLWIDRLRSAKLVPLKKKSP